MSESLLRITSGLLTNMHLQIQRDDDAAASQNCSRPAAPIPASPSTSSPLSITLSINVCDIFIGPATKEKRKNNTLKKEKKTGTN